MFEATCHCGNVRLAAPQPPESLTSCNCSVCHRIGALWAYYYDGSVEITIGEHPVTTYSWQQKKIRFHHCSVCGSSTHYTSIRNDGTLKVAINARMVAAGQAERIPVRHFDGAVSWSYID